MYIRCILDVYCGNLVNLMILGWQIRNFEFWGDNLVFSKFCSGMEEIFPNYKLNRFALQYNTRHTT